MSRRELVIVCQNPRCGQVTAVRRPSDQRTRKYCSRRCASQVNCNVPREASARGGRTKAQRARAALVRRVAGLTPVEAFRLGYLRGLQSKLRQLRQRYVLVRREQAA